MGPGHRGALAHCESRHYPTAWLPLEVLQAFPFRGLLSCLWRSRDLYLSQSDPGACVLGSVLALVLGGGLGLSSGLPRLWLLGVSGFPTRGTAELQLLVTVILWVDEGGLCAWDLRVTPKEEVILAPET